MVGCDRCGPPGMKTSVEGLGVLIMQTVPSEGCLLQHLGHVAVAP